MSLFMEANRLGRISFFQLVLYPYLMNSHAKKVNHSKLRLANHGFITKINKGYAKKLMALLCFLSLNIISLSICTSEANKAEG